MMEKKIVVPEGMLKAACRAWPNGSFDYVDDDSYGLFTRPVLEAALRWLAENPIVPTDEQMGDMPDSVLTNRGGWLGIELIVEWQKRMFLAPDNPRCDRNGFQECDACSAKPGSPYLCAGCLHNRTLIDGLMRPEPEIPGAIGDLFVIPFPGKVDGAQINQRIKEAFRRGRKAKDAE